MSERSSCNDITYDDSIKDLHECHSCLRLVCLNHLIEHIEITKQNKRRLDSVPNEINTEMMVKVEPPSSSEIKDRSSACKCNKENINSNDQSPLRNICSKSKSLIYLDSAIYTGIQLRIYSNLLLTFRLILGIN
ncbi:unnamed protein product [Rotaria sp. Silwood2]|nr:unnamed protein product [Rotaria sp. Silwood2]